MNSLLFIDTETHDLKDPRLVQLAWSNWINWDTKQYLYKPEQAITPWASSVHHITNEMVETAPSFKDMKDECQYIINDSIIVAHNAKFDLQVLENEWIPRLESHICTYKVAYKVLEDAENHQLQYLRYFTWIYKNLPSDLLAHEARSDVEVLKELFRYLLKFKSPEEMIEISSKPILLRSLSFGKCKWIPLENVPKSYLQWLLGNFKFDNDWDDLQYTIRHYLWLVN